MTTMPATGPTTDSPRSIDLARICVTARAVLDAMPHLVAEGLGVTAAERLTRHARALADLPTLRGLPLATMREHARAVLDALLDLGGERSLTLAVWFDDGLGTA